MTTETNAAEDQGGWKYNQVPRSEFYEELSSVLADFSDLLMEDAEGSKKLDGEIYNDWFYCGYGGDEDSFNVSLWPAYLPVYEAFEEGEISEEEYRAQCWPNTGTSPVTIYLGQADAVIELAEDEKAVQELATSFAEFAGIELVDDWDAGEDEGDLDDEEGTGEAAANEDGEEQATDV